MIYLVLLIFMFFSAFFSSLETGLLALGDIRINQWAENEIKSLKIWVKDPTRVITSILVGNNIVNITFSSILTVLVVHHIRFWNVGESWTETVSIICSSVLILIFGEIIPKTFANTHPDKIVKFFYRPFMKFYKVSGGLVGILNKLSFSMIGAVNTKKEKTVSRKELNIALENIEADGILKGDSSRMLGKVLFFAKKTVSEIMVPRKSIQAVNLNWKYETIIESLLKNKLSRIPAYEKNLDNLKGFVYIKDVIGSLNRDGNVDFYKILRKIHITYPGRNCQHLFQDLRNKRIHCSIVKTNDRIIGLVTIEDLIEEIVGEIYDEYDYMDNTA